MSTGEEKKIGEVIQDQPVRDRFEEVTEGIPEGPMGKVGGGSILGAVGYLGVEFTKPIWTFVPGVKQPGYKITAHGTKDLSGANERHILTVVAISEQVARFAAKYTAAPSNLDFVIDDVDVVSVDEISERTVYSTYHMYVDVTKEEDSGWF